MAVTEPVNEADESFVPLVWAQLANQCLGHQGVSCLGQSRGVFHSLAHLLQRWLEVSMLSARQLRILSWVVLLSLLASTFAPTAVLGKGVGEKLVPSGNVQNRFSVHYVAPTADQLSSSAREAIDQAVQAWPYAPPENNAFYLVSLNLESLWGRAVLTSADLDRPLAAGEDSQLNPANLMGLLLVKTSVGWAAALESDSRVQELLQQVPESNLSQPIRAALFPSTTATHSATSVPQQAYTDYKFPWYPGQPWKVTGGWHDAFGGIFPSSSALDFLPGGSNYDILASAPGVVYFRCDNPTDTLLVITTAGTNEKLGYLHLIPNSVTLQQNQQVDQGTRLGTLNPAPFDSTGPVCGYTHSGSVHLHLYLPTKPVTLDSVTFTQDYVHGGEPLYSTQGGTPPPTSTPPPLDAAVFTGQESPSDDYVASAGQAVHKTWTLRNTGRAWGSGYQLVFVGGEQLSAPSAVNVSPTDSGNTVELSVDIVAPASSGTHRGYWRLRNPQGTYFGDQIWVQVTIPNGPVPTSPPPTPIRPPDPDKPAIELTCLDCPATVAPNATFRPTLRVTVNKTDGQLSGSRGDMLRNTDNNLYGAWPHVALNGTVNPGQTYDFVFYADHPIQAPSTVGTYSTRWRIWRDGNWAGPELTIQFNVANGTPGNQPPNVPTATGPGDWSVFDGTGGITLQGQANGDPDGDSVNQYYFEVFDSHDVCNSGWISSNSWSPTCLGYWGYQWRARVKDEHGADSGWSEVRHFTINDPTPRIDSFSWKWSDPGLNNGNPWVIEFCGAYNGDGIRIDMYSYATDTWWTLTEGGGQTINCTADPSGWHHRWYQQGWPSGQYKARLYVRKSGSQWTADTSRDINIDTPTNQPPNAPALLYPPPPDSQETYVNSKTVRFDWKDTYRTSSYRLEVSTDSNFSTHLVDVSNIPITSSEYTYTFGTDYATLYWRVTANGPDGTGYTDKSFHLDITPPTSAVSALPAITGDSTFVVNWGGTDNRSGVRWYQVQVRDSSRPATLWADWYLNTTDTNAIFQGAPGHAYYFRTRASDIAGNWEDWPSGDGDTYIVINPAVANAASWWDQAFSWKRNLVIRNADSDAVPAHYPMHLRFDTTTTPTAAEIYQAALSNGNDVRVVYNDQTDLNRVIQHFSASQIDIWFPLQAGLGGLQSDDSHYQLYYGNGSAGGPATDLNAIFLPEQDGATIGLWHFQEGSGTTINDTSGRSHPGNFINAAWADGYLGHAGYFNGSNAGVNLGSPGDYNALGALTFEAWVYVTSFSNSPLLFYKGIGGGQQQYAVRFNTAGQLEWYVGQNCDDWMTSGLSLQTNHWYHVAAVFDGTREKWIYVNGVEQGHKTLNANCAVQSQSWPLYLGYGATAWPGTTLAGDLQHARLSNTARHDFAGARIDSEPEVKAGTLRVKPGLGSADLTVLTLAAYPNPEGGWLVQAVVQNQGNVSTGNGFFTDVYLNHAPTGTGDYTGSVRFWINDPIDAGQVVTLTTVITDPSTASSLSLQALAPGSEVSGRLYTQVDSSGVVSDTNRANNQQAGAEICLASADAYELDNAPATARPIFSGQVQGHNFTRMNDQDWVKFTAQSNMTYTLRTSNLGVAADTYLYLYGADGATILASNDDYGESLASQITWVAPADGVYYLQVRSWNPGIYGCGTSYWLTLMDATLTANQLYLPLVRR